jgi:hypothetical protein
MLKEESLTRNHTRILHGYRDYASEKYYVGQKRILKGPLKDSWLNITKEYATKQEAIDALKIINQNNLQMTGHEISEHVRQFLSFRMKKKLANELFRSRCDIKPAVAKLERDIKELQTEINQNENAIRFLNQFKEY